MLLVENLLGKQRRMHFKGVTNKGDLADKAVIYHRVVESKVLSWSSVSVSSKLLFWNESPLFWHVWGLWRW